MKSKKIQVISFQSLSANSGEGMARLGYYLSIQLQKRGLLNNMVVHSKGKYTTPFPSVPVTYLSRLYLLVLNRFNKAFQIPSYKFRLLQERLFDWFCQYRLAKDTDVIFTTNAYLFRTFKRAKTLGIRIILLPGTPEENYIFALVSEENKKLNITKIDAYTYRNRIDYFNKSVRYVDKVIGSLPTVYTSYSNVAFKGEVIKILGHMKPDFKPVVLQDKSITANFKVGYLAHTVVLKGLNYLLEAWQSLMLDAVNHNMHLSVAGSIDSSMQQYLDEHFSTIKNVTFVGHVSDVPSFMQGIDLFIVPSLVDGGPVSALEAAHYAVPVLITENCGSYELLSRGNSGCWIIPIRDADAIAEKIRYAYQNREDALQVGKNAKHNLEHYSMDNFIIELADFLEHKA